MTGGLRLACMLGDGIGPEIVPAARRIADEALARSGADPAAATSIEAAVAAVISSGVVTGDMGGSATTTQVTDAIVSALPAGVRS